MNTKAIRVFYRKSDGKIVWTHELRGIGEFPTTIEQDLAEILDKVTSREIAYDGTIISETKLGGKVEDYACIEEQNPQRASDALTSDENQIINGKLIIGAKRIISEPTPPRNLFTELDTLKARIEKLEGK